MIISMFTSWWHIFFSICSSSLYDDESCVVIVCDLIFVVMIFWQELHQRRLKMKLLVSSKSPKILKGDVWCNTQCTFFSSSSLSISVMISGMKEAYTMKIDSDSQQPLAGASLEPTCITNKVSVDLVISLFFSLTNPFGLLLVYK